VPAGGRSLKEGCAVLAVNTDSKDYVYLLKGSNTTEFWRHDIAGNSWEIMANAPLGTSGKAFRNGSALTGDGQYVLYALKGSYNEFFAYSLTNRTWVSKAPLPFIGVGGKKKKVKDGAAIGYHNGRVYALKGGNTNEFWAWQADSDRWRQLPDIPFGSGKKVKGGGSMTYSAALRAFFALKGNGTLEFYRYGLTADDVQASSPELQVQSNSSSRTPHCALHVAPNPFSRAATISYSLPQPGNVSLKLYDITGQLVTTLTEGYRNSGSYTISVGPRASAADFTSGVYVLKLEAAGASTTAKLIVE